MYHGGAAWSTTTEVHDWRSTTEVPCRHCHSCHHRGYRGAEPKRRFQHYRTPGSSQQTNLRLNGLFREHLERGGQIEVDVAADGVEVGWGGRPVPVDLNDADMRNLVESAGLVAGKAGGLATLNR